MELRTCVYCNANFLPNKYSPRQKVCSNPACQKRRQLDSMKLWRGQHPNYFKYDESKGPSWLDAQRRRSKAWRDRNPDKVRAYRNAHNEEYRRYMRAYMQRYRERKKALSPTPPPQTPENPNP